MLSNDHIVKIRKQSHKPAPVEVVNLTGIVREEFGGWWGARAWKGDGSTVSAITGGRSEADIKLAVERDLRNREERIKRDLHKERIYRLVWMN